MAKDHQKAFREAEKELQQERIDEIKDIMKSILQKQQEEREKKARAEEALRLLKLDMDDLRAGKIDKIRERHDKSKTARDISPIKDRQLDNLQTLAYSYNGTSGTLTTTAGGGWTTIPTGTGGGGGTGGTAGPMGQLTATVNASGTANTVAAFNWNDATSGTYFVSCGNGDVKEFNL